MLDVSADHPHDALATDNLAVLTDPLDAATNLHNLYLCFARKSGELSFIVALVDFHKGASDMGEFKFVNGQDDLLPF